MRGEEFVSISPQLLRPRLAELGKIKIGGRGRKMEKNGRTWFVPQKFTHFVVTTRTREKAKSKTDSNPENFIRDDVIHRIVGEKPTVLPVKLMWDDPADNFQYYFSAYDGTRPRCRGNGEKAFDHVQGEIPCTCPLLKQHDATAKYEGPARPSGIVCKPYGRLSVILDDAEVFGGYFVFRTTSWESISGIAAALQLFRAEFGGLRGLPLQLMMYPSTDHHDGKTSTSYKVTLVLRADVKTAYQVAAQAREWRSQNLLPASRPAGEPNTARAAFQAEDATPSVHRAQVEASDREEAEHIAGEFYETVVDDDEETTDDPHPLEAVCRRAMEIGGQDKIRITQILTEWAGRETELAETIEKQKPDAWKQALDEAQKAEAQKALEIQPEEPATAGTTKPQPDLFPS